MKWKLLWALTTIIAANHAYALHYKEWMTGTIKAKLTCKEEPLTLNSQARLINHLKYVKGDKPRSQITATTHIEDIYTASLGQPSYILGTRELAIWNFANALQTYEVILSICILKDGAYLGCNHVEDKYELAPGKSFTSNQKATLSYIFDAPGNYTIMIETQIENPNGTDNFGTYTSRDITIPA